jgi:hypothetical protein
MAGRLGAIMLVENTLMKTKEDMAVNAFALLVSGQFLGFPGSVASSCHVICNTFVSRALS